MPSSRNTSRQMDQQQLLRAMEQAKTLLARPPAEPVDREAQGKFEKAMRQLDQDRKETSAMLLAILSDHPCPIALFKPWASYTTLWEWEKAGRVKFTRKNGKLHIRPSAFFALFDGLPEDRPLSERRKKSA